MKLSYLKTNPTGNITLIVDTPVPRECQAALAAKLMELDRDAEQVGFFEKPSSPCVPVRLQMMGGEFCGNASICAAAVLLDRLGADEYDFGIEVSGADEDISVSVRRVDGRTFSGTVDMPIPESVYEHTFFDGLSVFTLPLVRFPGICHIITEKPFSAGLAEKLLPEWCAELNTEALGMMFLSPDLKSLEPLVYVASTGTLVYENSCASGTSAAAAYLASKKRKSVGVSLRQPGGVLGAEAVFENGAVRAIRLSGTAVIEGSFEIFIEP